MQDNKEKLKKYLVQFYEMQRKINFCTKICTTLLSIIADLYYGRSDFHY